MQRPTLDPSSSSSSKAKRKNVVCKSKKKRKTRKGSQADLIKGLYRQKGPLYGKKRALYAISKVQDDGVTYELARFVRKDTKKEENCIIALIRLLGFPDESETIRPDPSDPEQTAKVDALYRDLRLVFECDEVQHFDDDHIFNQGAKKGYQRKRDRLINEYYTRQGYYVIRVNATTGPFPVSSTMDTEKAKKHPSGLLWYPAENSKVLERARTAVQVALDAKRANYASGDFAGKVICVPDDASGSFANRWFGADATNAKARQVAFDENTTAKLRGTVEAMQIAMQAAAARLVLQDSRRRQTADLEADEGGEEDSEDDSSCSENDTPSGSPPLSPLVPPDTSSVQFGIDSLSRTLKQALYIGDNRNESTTTQYELYWRQVMAKHSPENKYQERLQLIDAERAAFIAKRQWKK